MDYFKQLEIAKSIMALIRKIFFYPSWINEKYQTLNRLALTVFDLNN